MTDTPDASSIKLPAGPGRMIIRAAEAAAWRDGYQFLEAAKREAEAILAAAKETYYQEHVRGYNDGRAEGAKTASGLIISTSAQMDSYLAKAEGDLVELSMTIVRQILGEIDSPELVGRAATHALSVFRHERAVRVTVHPDNEESTRHFIGSLDNADGTLPAIHVDVDSEMSRNGCVVSSSSASIDASINTQLAAIREAFAKTPEEGSAS